uniref:Sushi domain-containing protein n=1 Tax=Xenopus tropicalis TaxID=8364 RepID=A0A1B8Y1I1_XENTR
MSPPSLAPLVLTVFGVQLTCSNGNPQTAQCRLSEIKGINGTAGEKEHYDPGESVSVWCSPGYYPNNRTMRCIGNGTSATWDDPIRCTEQCRKSDLSVDIRVQLVPFQDDYLPNTNAGCWHRYTGQKVGAK